MQGKAPAGREDDRGCPYFMMPGDLVKRVVQECRWGAGGEAKGFGEGCYGLWERGIRDAGRDSCVVLREACCASEEFMKEKKEEEKQEEKNAGAREKEQEGTRG